MAKMILWIFIYLASLGCSFSKPESFILITVPHLGVSQVSCNNDDHGIESTSGISILCQESIRFTHTYTTSTLAAPSIASVLTGLYPIDHRLRTNKDFLPGEIETIGELALKNGYATSFFSGGLPIVRKNGLHQGFELFEDNFTLNKNNLFRNFHQSVDLFKEWKTKEANKKAFLSLFFVPDLQFTNTQTMSVTGEARNLTFESQFEEFDLQLAQFIQYLKQKNIWQNTHLLLIGTSGNQINRIDEPIKALNLNSENTQVAFLWKPASIKKRDLEQNWKLDVNINLADIGLTIKNLISKKEIKHNLQSNQFFPIISFEKNLKETQIHFDSERPLLIESGWPVQNNFGQIRSAVVSGKFLYINDTPVKIYNTLIDRLELYPTTKINHNNTQILNIQNSLEKIAMQPWPGLNPQIYQLLNIPYEVWTRKDLNNKLSTQLVELEKKYKNNPVLKKWLLQNTIENKKWSLLLQIAQKENNPFAMVLAESNIQRTLNIHLQNSCFQILYYKKILPEDLKNCNEAKMIDFIRYSRAQELGLNEEAERNKFKKMWANHLNEKDIYKAHIGLGFLWDLDPRIDYAPSTIDYVLLMPQFSQFINSK